MSSRRMILHLPVLRHLVARESEVDDAMLREAAATRPRTRGDCLDGVRPCPFVGCRYNLYLDAEHGGSLWLNYPDVDPADVPPDRSCSLDIADQGGGTLEDVGTILNVTRERARQIEVKALKRIQRFAQRPGMARQLFDHCDAPDPANAGVGDMGGSILSPSAAGASSTGDEDDAVEEDVPSRVSFLDEGERVGVLISAMVWRAYLRDSTERGFETDRGKRGTLSPELLAVKPKTAAEVDAAERERRRCAYTVVTSVEREDGDDDDETVETVETEVEAGDVEDEARAVTKSENGCAAPTRPKEETIMAAGKMRPRGELLGQVLEAYQRLLDLNGRTPTPREVFESLGGEAAVRSVNNVYAAIRRLEVSGRLPATARPVRVVEAAPAQPVPASAVGVRQTRRSTPVAPATPKPPLPVDALAALGSSLPSLVAGAAPGDLVEPLIRVLSTLRDEHRRRADALDAAIAALR